MMRLSLAACNRANNNNNNVFGDTADQTNGQKTDVSTGAGVDLKYDFTHMNDKNYHAHINLATDDEVTEFNENEPNSGKAPKLKMRSTRRPLSENTRASILTTTAFTAIFYWTIPTRPLTSL